MRLFLLASLLTLLGCVDAAQIENCSKACSSTGMIEVTVFSCQCGRK